MGGSFPQTYVPGSAPVRIENFILKTGVDGWDSTSHENGVGHWQFQPNRSIVGMSNVLRKKFYLLLFPITYLQKAKVSDI